MAVPPPPGPSFGDRAGTIQMYTPWELKKEDGTDRTPDERVEAFRCLLYTSPSPRDATLALMAANA